MMKIRAYMIFLFFLLAACQPASTPVPAPTSNLWLWPATEPASTVAPPLPTITALPPVPDFSHIAVIVFEKREFDIIIKNRDMPYYNLLADSYTLLTQHYAVAAASLPNYLALIGGDTFGVTDNCEDRNCYINARSLPDLIEASGRTWKTYQDDMPEPCFDSNTTRYLREHNPFIFFDSIRLDPARCRQRVAPLIQLEGDLALNDLPDFLFIVPDICYSSRECPLNLTDDWLKGLVAKLYPALESTGEPFLIILTWDAGQTPASCCGLPASAGGRVATVLISPQVRQNFQDATPYSHYSILKTISAAWGLPYLNHAADENTALITAPWR